MEKDNIQANQNVEKKDQNDINRKKEYKESNFSKH